MQPRDMSAKAPVKHEAGDKRGSTGNSLRMADHIMEHSTPFAASEAQSFKVQLMHIHLSSKIVLESGTTASAMGIPAVCKICFPMAKCKSMCCMCDCSRLHMLSCHVCAAQTASSRCLLLWRCWDPCAQHAP